ncbi:hypothetical protein BJ170DRAFT_33074 [Xylariales sp. AK1849]|nr:hypothetical protein BJ170DRAFT_33074 [Xylariales sp. AK1849]
MEDPLSNAATDVSVQGSVSVNDLEDLARELGDGSDGQRAETPEDRFYDPLYEQDDDIFDDGLSDNGDQNFSPMVDGTLNDEDMDFGMDIDNEELRDIEDHISYLAGSVVDGKDKPHAMSAEPAEELPKKSFSELLEDQNIHQLSSLTKKAKTQQCHLQELEQIRLCVEAEIAAVGDIYRSLGKAIYRTTMELGNTRETAGISKDLWAEYEAFCESLEPIFGSRGGWSITCEADHEGSYIKYDPGFGLIKEYAEMDFSNFNFRCEASTVNNVEYVVEFWPIKSPETTAGVESTWGERYVS